MKPMIILLASTLLITPRSWAEDAKPATDLSAYFDQLQVKLDHAGRRANQPSSSGSSVIGLRGSKQESKQLYWKGKSGATPVSTDEVKTFRSAVDLARTGKKDEATTELKAFLDKYPKSGLKMDVEEALRQLASAPKP